MASAMASFPFNKLPVELQLLVWHHARANVGHPLEVIVGDVDYNTKTLTLRGPNLARTKDYLRLLSICHISRQEALRTPLVFLQDTGHAFQIHQMPHLYDLEPPSLVIKDWHFGHVFSDVLVEIGAMDGLVAIHSPEGFSPYCVIAGEALLHVFGPTVRRLHIYGCDEWELPTGDRESRMTYGSDKPVDTSFNDADALRFLCPEHGRCPGDGILDWQREVIRQDVHGKASQNIEQPVIVEGVDSGGTFFITRKDFADLVTSMRSRFPDMEYISVLSWYGHADQKDRVTVTDVSGEGD